VKEFLDLHLGESGKPILEWINYMVAQTKAGGTHARCVGANWEELGLDHSVALKGLETFGKAMKLAKNDTIKSRVEKMSICAYRAALEPVWYVKYAETDVPWMMKEYKANKDSISEELASEMRPIAKRFFELCDKYNAKRTGEGDKRSVKAARERLEGLLGKL
jgi:hypothetical protein